jgi:hypothetical protein
MDEFWSRYLAIEQRGFDFLVDNPCRLDHYDVRLRIEPDRHSVDVTGTARGCIIGPGADEFRFLLGLDYRKPAEMSCMIRKLTLDGHPAAAMKSDAHMHRVAFPKQRHQGETFELTFDYSSVPVARKCWVNAQSDWPVPGLWNGETELCFEGYWLPFANALFQPVTFEIDIADVPGSVVVANGKSLGDVVNENERWCRYRSTVPTFPTVVAGNFEILTKPLSGGLFSFYYQAGYAGVADEVLATGSRIFDLFTTWLKKNPPGDLSLIQLARTGWGQYAPFPFIIFPRDDIKKDVTANDWKRISQMLAHEIGHFWFGNMLRSGPTEQWLSEGFAQYFNLLYTEYAFGAEALFGELQRYVSRLAEIDIENQAPLNHITLEHPAQAILVRLKGAVVLHCLRQHLGTERFIAFLAVLVRRYQGQLITTADVEGEVSQFLGPQNAHTFFDIHLRGLAIYTWDSVTNTVAATIPQA